MRRTLIILALSLSPTCSFAQTGFPPFGSFDNGGFDAVNRQNLNANFAIPIVSTSGRGMGFGFALVYDTLIWRNGGSGTNWYVVTDPSGVGTWGWKTKWPIGAIYYRHSTTLRSVNCGTKTDPYVVQLQTDTWSSYSYTDPAGTVHSFPVSYTDAQNCSGGDTITGTTTGNASDASGFFINIGTPGVSTPVVYTRSGTQITQTTLKDTNGNFITQVVVNSNETDWKDTANHTALRIVTVSPNVEYHYLDTTGNDRKFTLKYQNYSIKTAFNCTGITDYNLNGTMPQVSLPYELDLPNGQKYSFTYEPTPGSTGFYTGRLTQITLPTGGTIQYTYPATPNNGINCTDTNGSILNLTRAVSDGSNTSSWTYARTVSGSGYLTTITNPLLPYDTAANVSLFYFDSNLRDYLDQFYQGSVSSANFRRGVSKNWAANGTPSSRTIQFEDSSTQSYATTTFDSNGNILTLQEYGSSASPIRTTNWTYLTGSAYTAANILDHVTRVTVTDNGTSTVRSRTDIAYDESGYINYGTCHTGVPQHDDGGYSCASTTRGNPTTVTTYSDAATPGGSIAHHSYYDNLGNLVKADLDCCQSETLAFSSTTNYSFPDSVTRGSSPGPQLTTSATYDAYAGLVATSTEENGQVTHVTYDLLKRLTNLQRPDSTNLTWSYNDAIPPAQSSVTAGTPIQGTSVQQTTTTVDALGRPVTQQISDGTTTYSIVKTQYDPLGRPYMTSNPYTGSPSNWTTTQFDALGRPTKIILPDGSSATTYSYATNTITATDPAGKQKKSQVDGLGRMTSVFEPDVANGNSLTQQTLYAYNVLNLLTGVTQSVQSRTYVYDDLGRVTSVKTPETNQVAFSFQYNNFGLVTQRTDARGVITTYGYDTLNRPQTISYNVGTTGVPATSSVTYSYGIDSSCNAAHGPGCIGQPITMTDGVGSENYTYNNLGQVTQLQKLINGATYAVGYSYNLAGELSSLTYPSNRVVLQNFDAIGRLCGVGASGSTCTSGTNYANGFLYNPAFQVTGFKYGNNIYASMGFFSDTLLLQCLDYSTTNRNGTCTHDTTTKFGLTYSYPAVGSNNGLIAGITDNSGTQEGGRSVTFGYDALYRLTSAVTTGSTNYPKWGLTFAYDRYGNRLNETQTYGNPPTNSLSFANPGGAQTNRPDNMCFDANGNLMTETSVSPCPPSNPTYTYDAENRLVNYMGSSATYTFDGNGLRVKKSISGGTTTVYIFSGSKVIAEYDNGAVPTSPSREYIYSGGALLAKIEGGATTYFQSDHLSTRMLTDSSGNVLGQRGHFPFGETWYESGSSTKIKFTSYERDNESTNDYAMARTYINRFGRFSSTDPLSGSTANPQSLNRYTYAGNNPIMLVDPTGLREDWPGGCLYIQNHQDANSYEVAAGGPSADAFYDFSADAPPPPNCGGGGGGGGDCGTLDGVSLPCSSDPEGGFPLGGGPQAILSAVLTPTEYVDWYLRGEVNGDPWEDIVSIPIYGNLGLLALIGDPGDPGPGGGSDNPKVGGPCKGKTFKDLKYSADVETHIIKDHITTTDPNQSKYDVAFDQSATPSQRFGLVQGINALTFTNGAGTIQKSNGRIVFLNAFEAGQPVPNMVEKNVWWLPTGSIGWNARGSGAGATNLNTLVLEPDCMTVVTSHPGLPKWAE